MPGDTYVQHSPTAKRPSTTSQFSFDGFLNDEYLADPLEVIALLTTEPAAALKPAKKMDELASSRKRRASPFSPFSSGDSFLNGLGEQLMDAADLHSRERARTFNPDALLESLVAFPGDEGDIPNVDYAAASSSSEQDVHMTDAHAYLPSLELGVGDGDGATDDGDGSDEPRLGKYTQAERDARLEQYRAKRRSRTFGKVRYVLRQRVSEQRPRVKGRFIPKSAGEPPLPPFSPMSDTKQQSDAAMDIEPPLSPASTTTTAAPATPSEKPKLSWKARFLPTIFSPLSKTKQPMDVIEPREHRHRSVVQRPNEGVDDTRQRIFSWPMTRPMSPSAASSSATPPVEWRGFPMAADRRTVELDEEPPAKRSSISQGLLLQFKQLSRKSTAS